AGATAATPLARVDTSTGIPSLDEVTPSWLRVLLPQHLSPPAVVTAQLWKLPAATAATPLRRLGTSTGARRVVAELSPSWPSLLSPQHLTPPAVVSAQVWQRPAAIAATPLPRPGTSTGVWRCVNEPSPSCPVSFRPQHLTPPTVVSAQAWLA